MASDSVATFLELVRSTRLLPPDDLERLQTSTELPVNNLTQLCEQLRLRGLINHYQAMKIQLGQANTLLFAGYPITDELGPCPGGTVFQVLHPSLRTPLIMRRLRPEWLEPADSPDAYVERARNAAPISHPHLAHLLDAGLHDGELFFTQEPIDGNNLFSLVQDIGAMPTPLACLYLHQAALALQTIHERGLVHGGICPGVMVVGPLVPMSKRRVDGTPKFRPAPNSKLVLTEFGLIPLRPPLREWSAVGQVTPLELAFLAPERLTDGRPTPPGDIYSLGASFYYLLSAEPPVPYRDLPELLDALERGRPRPIASLRPDLPQGLVHLIEAMMDRSIDARPGVVEVISRLKDYLPVAPPEPPPPAQAVAVVESSVMDGAPVELIAEKPPQDLTELQPAEASTSEVDTSQIDAGLWIAKPYSGDSIPGIGTFTPESYDGSGQSSADLASIPPVQPDASWPGFSRTSPPAMPTTGWPGFSEPIPAAAPGRDGLAWSPEQVVEGLPAEEIVPDPLAHQSPPPDAQPTTPRLQRSTDTSKGNLWLWVGVGAGLQVLAILGWIYLIMSPGCSSSPPANLPKKSKA